MMWAVFLLDLESAEITREKLVYGSELLAHEAACAYNALNAAFNSYPWERYYSAREDRPVDAALKWSFGYKGSNHRHFDDPVE